MIKRYLQFIQEQKGDYNSIGEWVESLIDDDYIKNIVFRYLDSKQDINLSNAINVLDKKTQKEIKGQIDRYLQDGIKQKDTQVSARVEIDELNESAEISPAGKGIFTSFLKTITSLGQKDSEPNWEKCPQDFLIFYHYPNLESQLVKQIFSRFKSLLRYQDLVDYGRNDVDLYFGVRCDGQFEYGICYDVKLSTIGRFKLSTSVIKWIIHLDLKSAASLKKILVNLSYSDVLTFGKIKMDMSGFNPGYHERKLPIKITDRVISCGYLGCGKWDNGQLDVGEYQNIKSNFHSFVLNKKWGDKVLLSVQSQSFWVNLHIKLK
jgi:hypothetical protein